MKRYVNFVIPYWLDPQDVAYEFRLNSHKLLMSQLENHVRPALEKGPYETWITTAFDRDEDTGTIHRGKSRNSGINPLADIHVFLDADTYITTPQIKDAIELVWKEEAPWVIPYKWYKNVNKESTLNIYDRFWLDTWDHDTTIEDNIPIDLEHCVDSTAGMVVVPTVALMSAGGYDERYKGWGYEDNAFTVKMNHEWGQYVRLEEYDLYHLWHPAPETNRFKQPFINYNRKLYKELLDSYNDVDERYGRKGVV